MTNLQNQIVELELQSQAIQKQRGQLRETFMQDLTNHFQKYFRGVVSEDITIACTSSGIYFYKKNQEGTYDKEIFSVYLKENYYIEGEKYTEAQLSYYTTYADSDWELSRLENLGRVAQLMRNFKQDVISAANTISQSYIDELDRLQLWKKQDEIERKIAEVRKEIAALRDLQNRETLFSEDGLAIEAYIQFKYNYTARVSKLKLVDASKSGKKATAVFTYAHGGHTSREENVDVEKILKQISLATS